MQAKNGRQPDVRLEAERKTCVSGYSIRLPAKARAARCAMTLQSQRVVRGSDATGRP